MRKTSHDAKPPPLSHWLREIPNLPVIWSSPVRRVKLEQTERSNAHDRPPVIVYPGILSNDGATSLLRRTLRRAGYPAYPSRLGVVTGVTPRIFERAEKRLLEAYHKHQRPVAIVGISLGGLYARVLAQRHPEKVGVVLTMGTPFSGNRRANNAWRLYEVINDHTVDNPPLPDDPSVKPTAKTIAIWSPYDGIVAPECSRGEEGERDIAIEVPERHFEFSASRASVRRVVAVLDEHAV